MRASFCRPPLSLPAAVFPPSASPPTALLHAVLTVLLVLAPFLVNVLRQPLLEGVDIITKRSWSSFECNLVISEYIQSFRPGVKSNVGIVVHRIHQNRDSRHPKLLSRHLRQLQPLFKARRPLKACAFLFIDRQSPTVSRMGLVNVYREELKLSGI